MIAAPPSQDPAPSRTPESSRARVLACAAGTPMPTRRPARSRLRVLACAVVTALLGASVASNAGAETPPSAWDRAKRPELRDEYELHLTVQRVLAGPRSINDTIQMLQQGQLLRVLAMLQAAGAEKSSNPLLRFDLGRLYYKLENHPRAVTVWKSAIAEFPDHPLVQDCLFDLAVSCGHIGDHACEAGLYRKILMSEVEPAARVTPLSNLAETDMHNHDLKEAIAEYREVIRLVGLLPGSEESERGLVLGRWGLAVALDRAGEVHESEAIAELTQENTNNHGAEYLHTRNVFFVPSYEVTWYDAIAHAALARRAKTSYDALAQWQLATRFMTAWVEGAEVAKDYWLPIAKARLATYEAERKKAEAKVAKEAPRVVPGRTVIDL